MAKKRMYLNGKIVEVDEDLYNARTYESMMAPVYSQNVNDQLAPINKKKTEKEKEKQWYETIVEKPKAFDDGYQVGDIAGTVLGSTADAGLNALEGIFRVGEGIAKVGAGLLVEGVDAFNGGSSEYTEGVRRRIAGEDGRPPLTGLTQWLEDQISDYSIFGETGDEVFSGIGYTYGMLEGGKVLPGGGEINLAVGGHVARLPVLSAIGGASSGFEEAYQKGATGTQALEKAVGSGMIESITESMFGFMGIGGNDITDEFAKKFTSKFESGIAQQLARIGVSSTAEGLEEVISSAGNQFLDKFIDKYSGETDPKFYEKLNPDELAQEFVTTFLSTAITGGYDSVTNINHLTNNAINNFEQEAGRTLTVAEKTSIRDQVARALAGENTLNEQRVIDNEMNSRLAELGEYTRADRNRIRQEINQDLENGRISTDSISNTLPGITDQWNLQFNELRELQEEIKNSEGAEKDYLLGQYKQKLQEYRQDDRLRKSYVEEVNKGRTFTYEANENMSDLSKETYQSAVDSGMDNTTATHQQVELASKMADYTGVNIKFTTNDYLKTIPDIASRMTENTTVNGAYVESENTIYINKDSKKALETIIGHEIGHLLDKTNEGKKIRDFARKYADSIGEYNDRYTRLSKNYNENQISTEMANDIIGEYLFTDEEFVTRLATENPSTFQKIYDWFEHIFKMATSGSKEARQLEQVRYNLEKGLAKINENKVADTNVGESGKDINVGTKENVEKSNKIEYNKSAEREDFTDALSKEQWHRFYESVDKHGIEQNQEGAINTVIVDDKIIRSKYDGEKPNIFDVYKISEGFDELSKKFDITTSDILQDIYEIAEEENVDERKIKRSLEKYFKEGLLGRYDSNSNVFVDKNTNTRENIERNNSNIGKESRGREDLSRTKQNRSIDDTSFSLTEQLERSLEKTVVNAEQERQGMIDIFTSYLEENGIENPTQEDINNSLDSYDLMDANDEGIPLRMLEERYDRTIKEYLKEQGITLSQETSTDEELAPMVSRKKDGTLQIKQEDIKATDQDLERIFGSQINEEYDQAMKDAEKYKFSLSESGETTDSSGNKLTEKQQQFFKNSKATNEKGQLEMVFHTTTDDTTQFNTFNPVGTDHYRFGEQVVNYYTNSKDMSGSYANQDYEMVDTKKITTMQEVRDYIKEVNDYNEGLRNIELVKEGNQYKILDKSKVGNYDKTTDQMYKEAQKYAESLTQKEKSIFEDIYASTRMGEFDSDGRFNVDAFDKARGYEYGSEEDSIAIKYLNEIDARDYASRKIYTDVLFNDGRYVELASFDNRKDLYRNIKEVLSNLHSISTPNSHYDKLQYQGYVNITNPYILDAKGKNWNQVSRNLTDDLRHAYQNLTDSQKASIKDAMGWEDWGVFKDELSRYYKSIYLEDNVDLYGNEGYEVDLAEVGKMLHDQYTPDAPEGVISLNAYSDIHNIASKNFTDEAIEKYAGLNMTTNDIVKQVIEMNKNGSNYDGIIMKNVVDYGGDTFNGHKPADLFVTFESNQFKASDNLNPTEDEDIRYSLSNEEELAPTKESYPKSFEPYYEFAKEQGFLDDDERMMIFNGTGKEDKSSLKDKVTKPRDEFRKSQPITPEKSQMKKTLDLLDYMFVNRNSEIDNLARDSGNANIKYLGDMLNGVSGEAQNEIIYGQTNNQGERIGKSINELFDWANNSGLSDAFNDYLLHYSNIDRHEMGKGSRVHKETSEKMVRKYEKAHPEFKQHAEEVWNFSKNVRDNLLEAGVINQGTYDYLSEAYPHYVPYMEQRDITQYIDDSGKLKPVSTIKTAKGGATHSALTPVQEALTKYIYNEKKQVRQNDLYREIFNTIEGEKMLIGADDGTEYMNDNYTGLYRDENGNYLTARFDGEVNAIRISDDLYNQLNKTMERQIKDLEQNLSLITKPVQTLSNIRRNLLTTWSPSFLLKNPIKDFGDAVINSTDTKAFIKNYLPAYGELMKDTELARQFKALYGSGNAMGEYESESGLSTGKKVAKTGKGILQKIANFNEIVELAPRFAEFKSTIERGGSVQEAMYNAREVTINFNRGGVITKAMNRNGFAFLNASVQGFDKFIRNFSGQNGAIGVVGALMKATTFGVLPALFNHLIYAGGDEPDEEYEALPDYIKDNYYLIKGDNGTWIRIPKGRIPAVFGMVGRRTLEYAQGEEDAFDGMIGSIYDQVGFDPFNNHILAPIQQAYWSGENGRAWYGGDLVPTRLQDKPAGEQYDESTDAISKWMGSKFGISPYKLNYVLDQYTGGMGDMFLPMITEEASSDAETLPEYMLAPVKDQFIIDSTMDNKYAGEFYQTKEDFTIKSNSAYATDEDTLKSKYLSSVSSELSKLYQEKREVQSDSTLSKKQKYAKVKEIQDEINRLAKEGLEGYNQLSKTDNYAIVGDREYYKDGDEWKKVSDKELEMLNSLGLDLNEKTSYINSKSLISGIKEDCEEALETATEDEKTILNSQKKLEIIQAVKNSGLTDEAKAYLYTRNYGDYATVNAINSLGISMNDYLDLESQNFTSDKYANGKTVPNSKKKKTIGYINSMNLTMEQKVVLAKLKYPSMKTYNSQIIRYIQNNRYLDYDEKLLLLDRLGFKVENNRISW